MPIDVLMPQLSPTMTEGRLAKWNFKEGDKLVSGKTMAEVETDKATMEMEVVDEGILARILVQPGADVKVGTPIAVIAVDGETIPADYAPKSKAVDDKPAAAAAPAASAPSAAPAPTAAPVMAPVAAPAFALPAATGGRVKASPLAKRVAKELGVPLDRVQGTGPHGRIVRADVEKARSGGFGMAPVRRADQTLKHTPMRKAIATRLQQSKQTVPHFYLTVDVRMDTLMAAREQLNALAPLVDGKPAYKLTVNDFIIKASALALARFPAANASWYDDAMYQYGNVDISVAVAIEGGLITPILKNADQKPLSALSNEMKDLAAQARAGKLQPEQYQGGTFSVSNLGMYGIKQFEAIINPPQAAILAVGASEARAVVYNSQLVPAQVMSLSLSVDHRVIDGALGAEVLGAIKAYLENPITMMQV
jgi:pyruvate dehydrogenase E2 component (dihydrolipoamide acetyltransferase)